MADAGLDTPTVIYARFNSLTRWLIEHSDFYIQRPFVHQILPWEAEHIELAEACRRLSLEQIRTLEADPTRWEDAPLAFRTICRDTSSLLDGLEAIHPMPATRCPRGIPARKWEQIQKFSQSIDGWLQPQARIVDWCAGKGHLGRTLAQRFSSPVVTIEKQMTLCRAAQSLAHRDSVALTYRNINVLKELPSLFADDQLVGLHACGQLTDRLLEVAKVQKLRFAAVASCCYHATNDGEFHPQSEYTRSIACPPIDRHTLRLVTADEVVARRRIRVRREREHAFRLGLDLLVRTATGRDVYSPVPPVSPRLLDSSFQTFCETLARENELLLPSSYDPARAEAAGYERSKMARALGLVRALFRRPIELWLVLDRAISCLEAGRQAKVQVFCERRVTPRNLLLLSEYAIGDKARLVR